MTAPKLQPAADSTNDELARELILRGRAKGVVAEMGSGPTIVNTITDEGGSSGAIIEGLYPNAKEVQTLLGKLTPRSVSIEAVTEILNGVIKTRDFLTALVSSWQIPSKPTDDVDTHGWIALRQLDEGAVRQLFAHITLDVGRDRMEAKTRIARSGLRLLLSEGNADNIGCIFADQLYDENGNDLISETLAQFEYLTEGEEHLVLINESGKLQRPLDYFREMNQQKQMCIYKGSFNPITKAHLAIAKKYEEEIGIKPVFMISINNRDLNKGKVNSAEIVKRIKLINALGYSAMVCSDGGFVENAQMFRNRGFEGVVSYLAGADVAARVLPQQRKALKRGGHKIYLASRGDNHVEKDTQLFRRLKVGMMDVSSTQIRNREYGWENGIPEDILPLYKQLYGEEAHAA